MKVLKRRGDADRGWPGYLFRGHVRTSTVALILAFLAVWWVYDNYRPPESSPGTPATQVVPPGFVPDPNYTWVPRTRLQRPPATVTVTTTPTTTETTETEPTPPPLVLPAPFGQPPSTPAAP